MSFDIHAERRWSASAVWISVVLVLLAALATGATGAGAAGSTPDTVLLKKYQPVLVFHPNERFRPTKVQSFVDDSELERFVGADSAQLLDDQFWTVVDTDPLPAELPPATPGVVYRLDQTGCEADAPSGGQDCYAAAWRTGGGGNAVYGRVVRTQSRIVLQYWLFYYDNVFLLPIAGYGTFWQSHEGDWEVVNVILGKNEAPLKAAYSQHCSGQKMAWGNVRKAAARSTHPLVYVALGSHANYFAPGVGASGQIPVKAVCIPAFVPQVMRPFVTDQVLGGSRVKGATILKIEGTPWSVFGGRWGETEYFFTPVAIPTTPPFPAVPANTAVAVGVAPASPANQDNWNVAKVLAWQS